jgi:diketogulonate reductase-like aldo/keto reductase
MTRRDGGITRREFLGRTACGMAAGAALGPAEGLGAPGSAIPRRPLGKTGLMVSVLGFGGGSQFQKNRDGEWEALMERAIELGVNYFDTASDYGFGGKRHSEIRFGEILPKHRDRILICTKFNLRDPDGMKREVEESLGRLRTSYVDVLMLHSVEKSEDVAGLEKGVWASLRKLKEEGVARHIGFSSMNSAERSREVLDKLDPEVALLAMNPTQYGGFAGVALPVAREKGVGVLAMKVMRDLVGQNGATARDLLGYALGQDGVAGAVIGHVGMPLLEENARLVTELLSAPQTTRRLPDRELEARLSSRGEELGWARPGYQDRWV